MKPTATNKNHSTYALCVKNRGYSASLDLRKIYRILADSKAAAHGLVRVVDESGEDYLYPSTFFIPIDLPKKATRLFVHAA